jgi:hypothetical protein
LRAASLLNCPYEWQANEQMAKNTRLTSAEINAVAGELADDGLDADYKLVVAATDELLISGTTLHDAPPLRSAGRISSRAARRYHLVAVPPLDFGAMLTADRP